MYASSAKVVWDDLFERFNKVDGSRTFNLHKEIATLSQGTSSVSVYYSKLKGLWEEFEALVPIPGCSCEGSKEYSVHHQNLKLFQFLMGLNDSYLQARSQILMLKPVPSVNQAYSMILSDESQRSVVANAGVLGTGPASLQGSFDAVLYSRTSGTQIGSRRDLCVISAKLKDIQWKIVTRSLDIHRILSSKRRSK